MKKIGPAAPRQRAAAVLTHEEGQAITFCEGSVQALRLRCDLRGAPGAAADARSSAPQQVGCPMALGHKHVHGIFNKNVLLVMRL